MRTIITSECDQCNLWFWIGFPLSSQNTPSLSLKDKDPKKEQAPSMDERVRSLRIAKEDRLDHQSPSGWFPWLISIVFASLCVWLAYRDDQLMASIGFQKPSSEATNQPTNLNPADSSTREPTDNSAVSTTPPNASRPSSSPATGSEKQPSSNPIALESRGYVIAKHQVLVSPQVSGPAVLMVRGGKRGAGG